MNNSNKSLIPRPFDIGLLLLLFSLCQVVWAWENIGAPGGIVTPALSPDGSAVQTSFSRKIPVARGGDPVSAFGHGEFLDAQGKRFVPDPENIREVQSVYLTRLMQQLEAQKDKEQLADVLRKRDIIFQLVSDPILANGLLLDEILANSKSERRNHMESVSDALRYFYIEHFLKEKPDVEKGVYSKGIRAEIAKRLERGGVTVFIKTTANSEDYIKECDAAGVPIPPPMYADPWEKRGVFTNEFISESSESELWFYESKSPEGACLALPRYDDGKTASLFGIICVGKKSSNACFWDNPRGKNFPRNVPVDISSFVGGFDLKQNGQGTCTACHAGENPFVVHPDKPAFAGLTSSLMPDNWHNPLVHPDWPENPGPTTLLDSVSSASECDSCHTQSYAGRFPDVSDPEIQQYCSAVLETSVFGGVKRTMPQGGGSIAPYFSHIDALLSACFGRSTPSDTIPDDPKYISAPMVIGPLYACATKVAVSGTLLDAKVTLFINGAAVASDTSRSPSYLEFNVPALVVGDVVTAVQEFDGVVSDSSAAVTVKDHKVDYPTGLPAPTIDPKLIYECGNTIAVRHVPGATLTVLVNGGNPASYVSGSGWTGVFPGKSPFDLGDKFTASIELCSDKSPLSLEEVAVAAPATVNSPTFKPATLYNGQQLVTVENILHGAWFEVGELAMGSFGKWSTPVSWWSEFDVASQMGRPIAPGDQLFAQQTLCATGKPSDPPKVQECDDIPAPKIRIPLAGETFVIVTEAVPGARIQVYASNGTELGDGSGNVITLNRPLIAGEELRVTQSIDECKGRYAYKVTVREILKEKKREQK